MSQSLQDATSTVLDVLIKAGSNTLTAEDAQQLKEAAVVAVGSSDLIDVTKPANIILATLRPMLIQQIGTLGKTMEKLAIDSIEGMDAKYGKETIMTLWPSLSLPVKAIIVLLALATAGGDIYMTHDFVQREVVELFDAVTVAVVPLFALFIFATVPIKTLAYTSLSVGAKVVEARLQKSTASKPSGDASSK